MKCPWWFYGWGPYTLLPRRYFYEIHNELLIARSKYIWRQWKYGQSNMYMSKLVWTFLMAGWVVKVNYKPVTGRREIEKDSTKAIFWRRLCSLFSVLNSAVFNYWKLDDLLCKLKAKYMGGSRGRMQGVRTPPPWDDLQLSNTTVGYVRSPVSSAIP